MITLSPHLSGMIGADKLKSPFNPNKENIMGYDKPKIHHVIILTSLFIILTAASLSAQTRISMTDTGQTLCYDNTREISCPYEDSQFSGQDAQYASNAMAYRDNGDGTVTDQVTGLMWSQAVDAQKLSLLQAEEMAQTITLGGYYDWRVPNIKELYSLINFSGYTGGQNQSMAVPFINTDYFNFKYGNTQAGERYIDAQWLSSTQYVSTTMGGALTLFGVNFADGRIKGYGYQRPGSGREKKFYVRFVRNNSNGGNAYGQNDFIANGDDTITDQATDLMWMQPDSARAMNWEEALAYASDSTHAGYDDWRLPNAKELQYIIDYTRSPDTSDSPAIDPIFTSTAITNEAGQTDYPYYWTSTTHLDGPRPGRSAAYISFGRAIGQMRGKTMDVHGAGAQRSDPKTGNPQLGRGPQGDAVRSSNFVRLVRGGDVTKVTEALVQDKSQYPYQITIDEGFEADTSNRPDTGMAKNNSGSGKKFIKRLDKNGDNQVSRSEFHGPPQHFDRFDQNKDGIITQDEAPAGPPPGGGRPGPNS